MVLKWLDQMNLIDVYTTLHPKTAEYKFFSRAHGTFSRVDHMLGHKSLNKFKIKIISSIFSSHSCMTLEINRKKKTRWITNTWKLNNMLLINYWPYEELKGEILKIPKDKGKWKYDIPKLWDVTQAVARGQFIAIRA